MQDEYVKTFEKIHLDDNRKMEMRKALEKEMGLENKPAKRTRLGNGAKVGIAAAAVVATMGTLLAIPTTRNAISASIRSMFNIEVPSDATDGYDYDQEGRNERMIPTDDMSESEAAEVIAAITSYDQAQDEYYDSVIVSADYYEDPDLNELANFYAQQDLYIYDLEKDGQYADVYTSLDSRDWYSQGFFVSYVTGGPENSNFSSILVFKADEDQIAGFLNNKLDIINYEREEHRQETVSYDEFWTESVDDEGNIVYQGAWRGPEPEVKILPSDSARYMNFTLSYDAEKQIAVCYIEEGGGLG